MQIAVVEDGMECDRSHEEYMGRIVWALGGKITYQRFSESLLYAWERSGERCLWSIPL